MYVFIELHNIKYIYTEDKIFAEVLFLHVPRLILEDMLDLVTSLYNLMQCYTLQDHGTLTSNRAMSQHVSLVV